MDAVGSLVVEIFNAGDLTWRIGSRSPRLSTLFKQPVCATEREPIPITGMGYSLAAVHVTVARGARHDPGVDVQPRWWCQRPRVVIRREFAAPTMKPTSHR
jgi:hypothetical protein